MRQYVGFGSKQSKYHKNYHMIYKFLEEKMIIMNETARSCAEEDSNAFFHEKHVSIF